MGRFTVIGKSSDTSNDVSSVSISPTVRNIEQGAFYNAAQLTLLVLQPGVRMLANNLSAGLTTLTIPDSVRKAENIVFRSSPWYEKMLLLPRSLDVIVT